LRILSQIQVFFGRKARWEIIKKAVRKKRSSGKRRRRASGALTRPFSRRGWVAQLQMGGKSGRGLGKV